MVFAWLSAKQPAAVAQLVGGVRLVGSSKPCLVLVSEIGAFPVSQEPYRSTHDLRDENRPAFNVLTLAEWAWGAEVTKQFEKPHVYYLGSYQGCGCGFGGLDDEGQTCLRELSTYLARATANTGALELWSCWAGEEGAERLSERAIVPDTLLEPGFCFEEQEYLRVMSR